jgi:hypothetical protein
MSKINNITLHPNHSIKGEPNWRMSVKKGPYGGEENVVCGTPGELVAHWFELLATQEAADKAEKEAKDL